MLFSKLFPLAIFAASAFAHPEGEHVHISREELAARKNEASLRALRARACSKEIAEFTAKRKAKRDHLRKRQETGTTPHVTAIPENFVCITAPDVTEGPYYINNELVRNDLTEGQEGVPLTLDIGVIDSITCSPINNIFVELWAANATGVYSGYGGNQSPSKDKFGRGGIATNSQGIAEITTTYPGFYTGRTAHIHAMFHLNYQTSANGTLVSHAGSVVHIGQIFFEETWNDQVYATEVYKRNRQSRTLNSQDGILREQSANGNDAFADLELIGNTVLDGIYGYITIAVDTSKKLTIANKNYYTGRSLQV